MRKRVEYEKHQVNEETSEAATHTNAAFDRIISKPKCD